MSSFNPLTLPIALLRPEYLSGASAWVEHIPFAYSIVAMAQPRSLVELGTHKGDSYFAFCQAVAHLKLSTQCTAVDTWTGDAHAGRYSPQLYTEIRGYHDPVYGRFSRLLQSDFDAAVKTFADGSIDLLHIDGLHTYAAVSHDYEAWRPKLSPRAVVLFHDTAETGGDFGVHRFFPEVAAGRPAFNFLHGHGLGVLATGTEVPPAVLEFLAAGAANPEGIRNYYAYLGKQISMFGLVVGILSQATNTQVMIHQWLRQAGRPVDPRWENREFAFAHAAELIPYQAQRLQEVLSLAAAKTAAASAKTGPS